MKLDALPLNPALVDTAKKAIDMKKIDATAQDFEAMFLSEMFKPMFETVKVDETFGGGKTEEIFSGFLRDEYSKKLAQTGGIGIAELVKQELIAMQSRASQDQTAQNMHGITTKSLGENDVE